MTNPAPPILLGLSGATFLASAESGGFLQSITRKTSATILKVYDISVGNTVGKVFHDFKGDITVRLITTASTGVIAAAPGVVIVLANTWSANGVTTGGTYTSDTTFTHNAGQLQEFSADLEQYPNIS
jgi:hypothetical protein